MIAQRRSATILIAVVLIATIAYAVARTKRDFWDFEVYRTAGVRALAAEPLYRADDGHYQFKYWPAFAFAMIPFGFIHPEAGKIIWYGSSIACIAVFLRRSIAILPERRSTTRFLTWWALLLTGKFIVIELVNGQTNALLGLLIVLAVAAVQQGRRTAAGVLIGISAFVKPYALLFLPWLAVTQSIAAIGAAVAVLAVGWLFPALVYGWRGNLDLLVAWYQTVVGTTPENLHVNENISFATMWMKWLGEGPLASRLALVTTVVVLAAAVALWTRRREVTEPAYLEVSALLILVPLISPQGWDYVLLIAMPAIVLLVDRFRTTPIPMRLVMAVGFALTSFMIFDLMRRSLYLALMDASGTSIGALLLFASLAYFRYRSLA